MYRNKTCFRRNLADLTVWGEIVDEVYFRQVCSFLSRGFKPKFVISMNAIATRLTESRTIEGKRISIAWAYFNCIIAASQIEHTVQAWMPSKHPHQENRKRKSIRTMGSSTQKFGCLKMAFEGIWEQDAKNLRIKESMTGDRLRQGPNPSSPNKRWEGKVRIKVDECILIEIRDRAVPAQKYSCRAYAPLLLPIVMNNAFVYTT